MANYKNPNVTSKYADQVVKDLMNVVHSSGKTNAEIARRAGSDPNVLRKMRNGDCLNPGIRTIGIFAEALGYHIKLEKNPTDNLGIKCSCGGKIDIINKVDDGIINCNKCYKRLKRYE